MVNEKYILNEDKNDDIFPFFDSKIERLRSTLRGRINLLNLFKPLIEKDHIKLRIKNINVDINSEESIINYLSESNNYIEDFLSKDVNNWLFKNGSKWQKKREMELNKS